MSSSDLALSDVTKKLKRKEITENNIDIISNLPEALTSHILSFLSTKDAIRTSVLSKCWEYQWTKITNLSFDDQLLYGPEINNRANFMSLKILHLSEVRFLNEDLPDSIELNLSFPKLHEFKLHRCRWLAQKLINIDAPELTSCTIADDECDYRLVDMITYSDVKIYAPNLCEFICGSYLIVHIILVDPSSIVNASIELCSNKWEHMMAILACDLLQQLCGVKHLTLSRRTISVLCRQNKLDDNMVTFNFPLHLTITWGIPSLRYLVKLFRRLPGLLSLTFSKGNPYVQLGYLPRCSLPNLKVVKILSCFPSELAKFILVNATALEEMIITCNENLHMDPERLEEIVREDLQSVRWASSRVSIKLLHKRRRED